ncbi:unnamed protein product [Paramecium pentaurelia]|uniref:Cyclic nucleotide-binding domain-containing protein n=1 Tax=Paramecium pentaurelia TaxID=43138 RepID=A0A8S1Y4U6_9CILI|nr:unnamed protein product [Paramecium pentaurelia]
MIISQISNNEDCPEPLETNINKSSKVLLWGRRTQHHSFGIENPIWKYKALRIILIVSRFIVLITRQITRKDMSLFTKQEFNLIKDKAADYNFYKYQGLLPKDKPSQILLKLNNWFSCILQHHSQFLSNNVRKWLLKPDDTIIIIWNIYLILIVTINVFYVSLRISFPEIVDFPLKSKEFFFEQLPVYSFLLEIILKFNTCIYNKGILITNRAKIVKFYCIEGFLIDLFLVVPFFIGQQFDFRYFDFVIILKVFQLSSLFSSLFNRLELSNRQTALFDLFKMISFMILVAHFSACIWHIIGQWGEWGNHEGKTWLKVANLQNESWLDRYVVSFYWSIVTMTTIGYGDITPVNLTERIFVIFMTMISSATFAYTVNNIGGIFQDFSKQSVHLKNNMNQLNRYLKSQNVSDDLQIKFRRYFEYLWSKPSQKVIQFSDLIPKSLKDQMIVDVNAKILNQLSFFKNFSQPLQNKLCMYLEERQIQSDDYLFKRNNKSSYLFILVTGEIKLVLTLNDQPRLLQKISNPSFIGQLDFFSKRSYSYDAVASKTTKVLQISRDQLHNVFKDHPSDYEIFQQITDDIAQNLNLKVIQIKCNTCQSDSHFTNTCPSLFGIPNRIKTLYNYRRFTPVDRTPKYIRHNHTRKMYALKHHFIVLESVLNYMMKNEDLVQIEEIKELQQQHGIHFGNQYTFNQIPQTTLQMNTQGKASLSQRIQLSIDESSPRTFRFCQQNNQYLNTTGLKNNRKTSINYGSQAELPEEEVPVYEKIMKKGGNESLCVMNEQGYQQVLQVPQLQINQVVRRKSVKLKLDDSSEDEEEDEDKILGQYIDIFQQFERVSEFSNYNPHNNISQVVAKFQEKRMIFQRQTKKRKSRRQETLLHLLKQAQGKQRL